MRLVLALAVAVTAGCSGGSEGPSGQLTVFAASSLTATFTKLGAEFEAAHPGVRVSFSFAGSSALAQQLLAGAPADVFASASTKIMAQVAAETGQPSTFARNVAQIAVSPEASVRGLADLARPGLKVALCETSVPCGAVAEQVLQKAHVTVHPVTRGIDVKGTLGYVLSGAADAAIVYVTDVRAAGGKVRGVEIPAAVNVATDYQIATLTRTGHSELAQSFEDFVLSAHGQAVLTAAGFRAP